MSSAHVFIFLGEGNEKDWLFCSFTDWVGVACALGPRRRGSNANASAFEPGKACLLILADVNHAFLAFRHGAWALGKSLRRFGIGADEAFAAQTLGGAVIRTGWSRVLGVCLVGASSVLDSLSSAPKF